MQRLVYAPKAFVYVKAQDGTIYDLSKLCVAGTVGRRINQVSSASVTIQNPDMMFTQPGNPTFHPQDPITIYLMRVVNKPVRVFTGFLDRTKYYQMYPGTFTLTASCTLKKLLYTFFDATLPYTISFLAHYGWYPNGSGIWNPQALAQGNVPSQDKVTNSVQGLDPSAQAAATGTNANAKTKDPNTLTDSSIGNLLFATLKHLGEWDEKDILVENLPSDLIARVSQIYKNFEKADEKEQQAFVKLMTAMIGTASYGSGGGNTSGSSGGSGPIPTGNQGQVVQANADHYQISPQTIWGVFGEESSFGQNTSNSGSGPSGGAKGPFQFEDATWQQYGGGNAQDFNTACEHAAHYLHDLGANTDAQSPQTIQALNNYNGNGGGTSMTSYASGVINYGKSWQAPSGTQATPSSGSTNNPSTGGSNSSSSNTSSSSSSSSSSSGNSAAATTRKNSISSEIGRIGSANLSYSFGGSHGSSPTPDNGPFDCSSFVSHLIQKAYPQANFPTTASGGMSQALISARIGTQGKGAVTVCSNSAHAYIVVDGRVASTGANPQGGPGWLDNVPDPYNLWDGANGGTYTTTYLTDLGSNPGTAAGGGGGGGAGGSMDVTSQNMMSSAKAAAFAVNLQWPSMENVVESVGLQGSKSLMNDQALMPFIQQLADGSLRQFQSMPDGKFFAFYPDYFGEFYHRPAYWLIDDIEILDGSIELTDEGLATHVYVVGDTLMQGSINFAEMLMSAGVVTIYNAWGGGMLNQQGNADASGTAPPGQGKDPNPNAKAQPVGDGPFKTIDDINNFLKRYGPRPDYYPAPMIRSPYFEAFLAYQRFMLLWSRQFATTFTFTFMPELYPGGHVGFWNHGLQMYIESVDHSWDLESGFTTQASLSAPSVLTGSPGAKDLPPTMVDALVTTAPPPAAGAPDSKNPPKLVQGSNKK